LKLNVLGFMEYYLDNNYFFITCRTNDGKNYFYNEEVRGFILNLFKNIENDFNIKFSAYSILLNHYHFLLHLQIGKDISKVINKINGNISHFLKDAPKPLWDIYHNSNAFDEESFYKILGYIAGNPFKHDLVKNIEDLKKYRFSNYNELAEKYSYEGINEIICNVQKLNWELKF